MSTPDLDALRDALTAARPGMTREQRDATDALLTALVPRMAEPKWPGAPVMAGCTVRVLDYLLGSGWTVPEGRAE